jgi:hypothetical protein
MEIRGKESACIYCGVERVVKELQHHHLNKYLFAMPLELGSGNTPACVVC